MSIANFQANGGTIPRVTPDGAMPIADILNRYGPAPETDWTISRLDTAKDRAIWSVTVMTALAARSPDTSAKAGKTVRERVLVAISYLAKRGSVTHPVTLTSWKRLLDLITLCADAQDWAYPHGPILGASNHTLEDWFNRTNPTRTLRELAQWGFIVPFSPKLNGHRSYKRGENGPKGSGWSLAPLKLLVDALEDLVAAEEDLRALRIDLPRQIDAAIRSTRAIIKPFIEDAEWARNAATELIGIAAERDIARKGKIERMQDCLSAARTLLRHVENCATNLTQLEGAGIISSSSPDTDVQYHYNDPSNLLFCSGLADGEEHQPPSPAQTSETDDGFVNQQQEADPHGIVRSGFTWSEAQYLFPFHDGMLDLTAGVTSSTAKQVALLCGITPVAAAHAEQLLGLTAAVVSLLIVGQKQADGGILKSPQAYFAGMINKARQGELNIGNTLFSRRLSIAEPQINGKAVGYGKQTAHHETSGIRYR